MCIVAVKPSGSSINWTWLERMWRNNPDGAGLMFRESGRVLSVKGLMMWEDCRATIDALETEFNLTERETVFHFRIATAGDIDEANCHPFPIDPDTYRSPLALTDMAIAHNGVVSGIDVPFTSELSDTALLVRDYLIPHKHHLADVIDFLALTGSRYVLMRAEETLYVGDFIADEGWALSNDSYRPQPIKVSTSKGKGKSKTPLRDAGDEDDLMPWDFDEWDDYEWDVCAGCQRFTIVAGDPMWGSICDDCSEELEALRETDYLAAGQLSLYSDIDGPH